MLQEYRKYCKVKNFALKSNTVDLRRYRWIYPVFLVPLCNLIITYDYEYIPPTNPDARNYIETVITTEYSKRSTYIPLQPLPINYNESSSVISNLQEWCDHGKYYGGLTAFSYLFSELIDNIYQHSEFDNAYVIAQSYPRKGFSEVCIFDDGISIPKSFENHNIKFKNDAYAIFEAINGYSTKEENRENGLNSTIDMYTDGGKAEALIISRNGVFYKKHGEPVKLYNTKITNISNAILAYNDYILPLEGT